MSCRHDLANGTCLRCCPSTGSLDPGPDEGYGPNLDGPGSVPPPRVAFDLWEQMPETRALYEERDRLNRELQKLQRSVSATFEEYWATTGPWPNNILGSAFKEVGQKAWEAARYEARRLAHLQRLEPVGIPGLIKVLEESTARGSDFNPFSGPPIEVDFNGPHPPIPYISPPPLRPGRPPLPLQV